jgi:hypothetical protein
VVEGWEPVVVVFEYIVALVVAEAPVAVIMSVGISLAGSVVYWARKSVPFLHVLGIDRALPDVNRRAAHCDGKTQVSGGSH